ncbi:MAG: glycoside hydrolase family 19 protein [Gemmatimonas sp.]|jgi:putative chitinase|uniref:glycoside hydrolase family 19 protein n=1 Tax=Gemmatimonas sp. TaxID=1962908 RepID=UPI00391F6FB6|nr:glycoside hydrolase family 19 protein [Gemmatimonadota bacterium]
MKTRVELLKEMGVRDEDAEQYVHEFEETLPQYGIADSRQRLAHFFAQILHESGSLRFDMENLNYSADGLLKTFPKYFPTRQLAESYARQPERIANRVYASRMGNGDEASGDGWRYRGRGLIQLTGRSNYAAFATWINDPRVMESPDLVATDYAVHSAVYFWDTRQLNTLADQDDVVGVTKKINGGTNGLAHRKELLNKANGLLGMLELANT